MATVRVLMDKGADVFARGTLNNESALQLAAMRDPQFLPLLLPHITSLDIWNAAVCLDLKRVRELIGHTPSLVWAMDDSGRRALHYCAASALYAKSKAMLQKQLDIAEVLVEAGAAVNATHLWGGVHPISVLFYACGLHDNPALTEWLVQRGALIEDNESVYHASDEGHDACLAVLERYAYPAALAVEASMCLRVQLHWGRTRGMVWLLAHGANPNTHARPDTSMSSGPDLRKQRWVIGPWIPRSRTDVPVLQRLLHGRKIECHAESSRMESPVRRVADRCRPRLRGQHEAPRSRSRGSRLELHDPRESGASRLSAERGHAAG
jgi:hypothetical protein